MVQHKVNYKQVAKSMKTNNNLDFDLAIDDTLMTVTTYAGVFVFGY